MVTSTMAADVSKIEPHEVVINGKVNGMNVNALLPKGNYTLVGIDIDTTGRRLIDEIVQLAAYTPTDSFQQYMMPYMNLNPAARQRHQVRVISIGFYRMLKSMQTYKIIKSKSEIAVLKDFLDWLENLKSKDPSSLGIVFLFHEERKFIPYMILEALKKYSLFERFNNTVKGFINGLNLAKANAQFLQHFPLRKLCKVLKTNASRAITEFGNTSASGGGESSLNGCNENSSQTNGKPYNDTELEFEGNASVRAKLAYEIAWYLTNVDPKDPINMSVSNTKMLSALHSYAYPIESDLNELHTQSKNLDRQNTFRPVFLHYFKTTIYHRVRAVRFRIILAENGYDLQNLKMVWSEKKHTGLVEIMQGITDLKMEEKTELANLLDSFFDPNKTTIKPVVKTRNSNRRRNRRVVRNNIRTEGNVTQNGAEQGAGGDKQAANTNLPDSTTKPPRARRYPRARYNQNNIKKTAAMISNSATVSAQQNKFNMTDYVAYQ